MWTKGKANALLLLVAIFWGSGSVVTRLLLDAGLTAGFTVSCRGAIFAGLTALFFHGQLRGWNRRALAVCGGAGAANFLGYAFQAIGVAHTTPSNNAFLAAIYVVLIPFFAWLFFHKKPTARCLVAVTVCLGGMAVLAGVFSGAFQLNVGDIYSFLGAVFYAVAITLISYGAEEAAPAKVSFSLGVWMCLGGGCLHLAMGGGAMPGADWGSALPMLAYVGVVCSFLAQSIQVRAQRHTPASTAGLIMMIEALFASIFSILSGLEPFTPQLAIGGALILAAFAIMEIEPRSIGLGRRRHA